MRGLLAKNPLLLITIAVLAACGSPASQQGSTGQESQVASLVSNFSSGAAATRSPYVLSVEGERLAATYCISFSADASKIDCEEYKQLLPFSGFVTVMKQLLRERLGPIEPLETRLQSSFAEAATLDDQLLELSSGDPSSVRARAGELFRDFSARIAATKHSLQGLSTQIARIERDLQTRVDPDLRTQLASIYLEKQNSTLRLNALKLELSQRRTDLISGFSGVQPVFFSELRRKRAAVRSAIETQSAALEGYLQKWSDLNQILSIISSQRLKMEFKHADGFFADYEAILRLIPKALDLAIEDTFEEMSQVPLAQTRAYYRSFTENHEFTARKMAQDLMRLHPQLRNSGCVVDKGHPVKIKYYLDDVALKCRQRTSGETVRRSWITPTASCNNYGVCSFSPQQIALLSTGAGLATARQSYLGVAAFKHAQTQSRKGWTGSGKWQSVCIFGYKARQGGGSSLGGFVATSDAVKCDLAGL